MLASIYHMTLKILEICIFGMIMQCFAIFYTTIKVDTITKSVKHLGFINFIAWHLSLPSVTSCDKVVLC